MAGSASSEGRATRWRMAPLTGSMMARDAPLPATARIDQAVEQADFGAVLVELHLPHLLVEAAQQAGQVAFAQGVAQGKGPGVLVAGDDGLDIGRGD